ncbi:hypothetical protein BZA05DRAFT_427192 [Tricharina praecox]|uniref:uncharacterized protein n=1 Tax=Tricharina praecox TaxID=43433 RepID=UPI002220FC03|nr:uncharacterized protein BZA05DRAFT_427192 [Tricharina praecox]KAI5844264.1 hypothetical protein BZA05DRAFT_427192 [Tricharina praecox]
MAPSLFSLAHGESPPSKRLKSTLPNGRSLHDDVNAETEIIQPHPLRIKPSGNAFTSSTNLRDTSCGQLALFPDELILQVLGYLVADDLNALAATSKALYGFSRTEELWKALFIGSAASETAFTWRGTWRRTLLDLPESREVHIALPDLYSDALYRPFHMSQIPLAPFVSNIPPRNQIRRFPDLTEAQFNGEYSSMPFILTSPVKAWSGYRDDHWTYQSLERSYGDVRFRAESVDWRLSDYISYMENQTDESPLYLFDRHFVTKTQGALESGFAAPACFGRDFFEVLGADRPDHRWLILGPARSGSTFHKDPNATSAWNAVLQGEKYWIMFPPNTPPPGVFVSQDQSEVTSPLSIAEWLVGFHRAARGMQGCIEGVCRAGEVLHVPSGWWHLVVNTAPSLALTQNFIPSTQLPAALEFLDVQRQSVSGFNCDRVADPYGLFVQRMEESFPKELAAARDAIEARKRNKKRNRWGDLVGEKKEKKEGGIGFSFAFGFGGADDSDDE